MEGAVVQAIGKRIIEVGAAWHFLISFVCRGLLAVQLAANPACCPCAPAAGPTAQQRPAPRSASRDPDPPAPPALCGAPRPQARIDQLRAMVAISKCAPRTFGPEHWKDLQRTLAGWKEAAEMAQTALAEAAAGAARPAPGALPGGPAPAPVRA